MEAEGSFNSLPMTSSNTTRDELRVQGFDLIDETLSYLISCLSDALKSLGEDELIPYIPWSGQVPEGELPKGTQQLYSVGFQLLNMVEERVASAIRREREKEDDNLYQVIDASERKTNQS